VTPAANVNPLTPTP
jgi:hypothetical protein